MSPAIQIEGTLSPGELSEEVVIGVDDQCRTVIHEVVRIVEEPSQGDLMQSNGHTDWVAWTMLRLYGVYEVESGTDWDTFAETEVEFGLREQDGEFTFNYPAPEARCVSSWFPTITWTDCNLVFNINTSTRKKLTTETEFSHHPDPQMDWDQTVSYDANISGTDRYRCYAGPHPSYLKSRCRGDRDPVE